MIGRTTPQQAGFSEASVERFMATLRRHEINMHSVIMMRGNDIFCERYWQPYDENRIHRMYSVTKSFVAIAIGCLLDEGKLKLDDPIVKYFPDKLPGEVPELLKKQTIRHMLTMNTCFVGINWFKPGVTDRTAYYFSHEPVKPAGALFDYDSIGSYILGVLVERLSGMSLLDYLKEKVLNRIGGFESAQMLKTPDGTSWGDSALLCTPRALANFARFVMNYGEWEGERLLSEEYLRDATRCWTPTDLECRKGHDQWGYGYQIWMTEQNGFAFYGMGGQFAICVPEKDFILVCTGDSQYNPAMAYSVIFRGIFEGLLAEPDPETKDWTELDVAHGEADSKFARMINGAEFVCDGNPMGITRFNLELTEGECVFDYTNAQGHKRLTFGMKKNIFGKFPQLGYSDEYGNVHEITDFRYDCAASAGWINETTLQLRVQIVDRYFGSLVISFGFADPDTVGVRMIKIGEDFLDEYQGWMIARRA